jgi:[ribosomal protein S5]-alanine N-acetyltransferase
VLEYAWHTSRFSKVYAGHHPDNRASQRILEKLGFEFIGTVLYGPTGLMHPSYVRKRHEPVELHPARR